MMTLFYFLLFVAVAVVLNFLLKSAPAASWAKELEIGRFVLQVTCLINYKEEREAGITATVQKDYGVFTLYLWIPVVSVSYVIQDRD